MVFANGGAPLGCTSTEKYGQNTINGADTGPVWPDGDQEDLVLASNWTVLESSDDPYPSHGEPDEDCDAKGVTHEDGVIEVNTNDCSYVILGQGLRTEVRAGDWIDLLMYHSALAAVDTPAEGHFSLWVGGQQYWEANIPIPAAAEIYSVVMPVEWSALASDPVRVHLHNHGGNSWRIAHLRRLRGEAIPVP
jgi:hypothetical protein